MTGKQRFFTILGMIVGAFLLVMSFSVYFPEKNYAYAFGCLGAGIVLVALMIFVQYRLREKYGNDTIIGWIIEKVKGRKEEKRREEARRAAEERSAAHQADERAKAEEAARLREEQETSRKAEEQAEAEIEKENTTTLHIEVQNVRCHNTSGEQPQTVLRRCYEKQENDTYNNDGALFEPYKLPDGGWTYAVIIDGAKVGDTTPEIAEQIAELVREGARNTFSMTTFHHEIDRETGEQFYTCSIWADFEKNE